MIALWLMACGGDKDASTTGPTPTPTALTCTRQACVSDLASAVVGSSEGGRVQLVDPSAGNCQLDEPGCALLTITGAAATSAGTMRIGWGFAFAADDRELWFTGSRHGVGVGAMYAYESATRGIVGDAL